MANAARYLFDLDFSAPPEPEVQEVIEETPPEPMITVAEHERLLAEAVERARLAGEQAARADREQLASEESLTIQKTILEEVGMIYTEVGVLLQRLERDASNLAFAFASRFAEHLVAQEPKSEVQALLHQILAPLRKTPHISIRLNDEIAEEIRVAVDLQMAELGFEGTLTVLPDPAIMPGDCEVEWADGGIGRNMRSAIRQVEQIVAEHFAHVPPDEDEDEDTSDGEANQHTNEDKDPEAQENEAQDNKAQDNKAQDNEAKDETNPDAAFEPNESPTDNTDAETKQQEGAFEDRAMESDDMQQEAQESPLASNQDSNTPDADNADLDDLPEQSKSIPATEIPDADFSSDFSPEVDPEIGGGPVSDTAPETEEDML
ncbi:Flagellar biosynthesis/type III secretory pathway protein FliH [Cohaesibacter sp. ES.047]|uniref:FliH/SctL family protein n=1 Tax=Cohaesibacter sp. ES.047 TaxID=1798205 RepID=UPI000BB97F34|nr:FliH/SctL family protein [Cohaesibacter sp. ES.047]SNY91113.1 Flagellar biosynthesis/type III secretory pathway protein FliH [Cohaesibacter sp. ES.047]